MEVILNTKKHDSYVQPHIHQMQVHNKKKMDKNEKIVRKTLIRVWIEVLEYYARPGVTPPSVEDLRRELFTVGVEESVKAVKNAHWFLPDSWVRGEVEKKVGAGLDQCDLAAIIRDTVAAQSNPSLLPHLREEIIYYVSKA